MARENLNSGELLRSAVMHHHTREPVPTPAIASRLNRRIGDERPILEAEITIHLV
jgi:hypothetical protein